MSSPKRILVIKLGALGDFVLALGPFAAIRAAHEGDHVTLLTTRLFAAFAEASGYFDDVWIDRRPSVWNAGGWLALGSRLRGGRFDRVYDLQTSDRSGWYFRLIAPMWGRGGRPEWSGIALSCSHPHRNPRRDFLHSVDRQAEQLHEAGIEAVPATDLSWVEADAERFGLGPRFALLAPGGAPHRRLKRWPATSFAELANCLAGRLLKPVLLGVDEEKDVHAEIRRLCPDALSLAGQTELGEIVVLARAAAVAIGNDTGPMHLIAAAGCPSVVLFSNKSDPVLTAPRGASVTVLARPNLAELTVAEVEAALNLR